MNRFFLILSLFAFAKAAFTQDDPFSKEALKKGEFLSNEIKINDLVSGGLALPKKAKKPSPLLIFIPDQGPVDRNGNQPRTKHFAYKQLSDSLVDKGMSTFRYDKRTFTQIKNRVSADSTRFQDYVVDALQVIERFKNDRRFSKIYLIGHGQGSLTALLAMNPEIDGLILIAGAGESLDDMIVGQIAKQQPGLDKVARKTFDKILSQNEPVTDIERDLYMIIGPEVQPFMKSWMQYDPTALIKEIEIPIAIINGDMNRQMDPSQTEKLNAAATSSEYHLIKGMNHIFKMVGRNELQAAKSFIDPNFPIHPELINIITSFVKP